MSSKVRLLSWSPGLNKVQFTKLIREAGVIPLNEAHDLVNRFLADEPVELAFSSEEGASRFIGQLGALGVNAERVGPATGCSSDPAFRKAMEDTFQDNELCRKLSR
jgi:hypothetical protein